MHCVHPCPHAPSFGLVLATIPIYGYGLYRLQPSTVQKIGPASMGTGSHHIHTIHLLYVHIQAHYFITMSAVSWLQTVLKFQIRTISSTEIKSKQDFTYLYMNCTKMAV